MRHLITREAQEGSSNLNWLAVAMLTMIFVVSAVSEGMGQEPQQAEPIAPQRKVRGYKVDTSRKDEEGHFISTPVYEHDYSWSMTPDLSQLSTASAPQRKMRGYQAGIDSRTGAIKTYPVYEDDHSWLQTPDLSQLSAYPVVRVIDGDTIVVNDRGEEVTVRLIGVDTPETVHPNKDVEDCGKEASDFMRDLLRDKKVFLKSDPSGAKTDRYGRALAYVYRAPDGLFVNTEIIRQGYGYAYTRFPFKRMKEFTQLEQLAQHSGKRVWTQPSNAGKGLWVQTSEPMTIYPRFPVAENGSYYGQISEATGRPKTVHVGGYWREGIYDWSGETYVRGHYRSKPTELPTILPPLGAFDINRYHPDSLANPYGAGSRYKVDGLMNPYSQYGSRYSNKSWRNPYATDAPKLYDSKGNYRGRLSSNPYDPDSTSNPYGRYGSKYSPDSINNPYGAGNPYSQEPIYVVPSK